MSLDHTELRCLQQVVTVLQGKQSVVARQDPHLPNLLQEVLRLVTHGVYEGSFFIDLVEQSLGHNEESPHETLLAIRERTDLSREDATKLYLVYSLSAREPLWYVVDQCCGMKDVLQAYYDPTALMCDDMFVISFVAVLRSLSRINFINMDVCVMPCYAEECAPLAVGLAVTRPSESPQLAPKAIPKAVKVVRAKEKQKEPMSTRVETDEVSTQTWVAELRSFGQQTVEWKDPRDEMYRRLEEELTARSFDLAQREAAVDIAQGTCAAHQKDLEYQTFALGNTVKSLKTLYDELFNRARVGEPLTESKLNAILPTIIKVINGATVTVDTESGMAKPSSPKSRQTPHGGGSVPLITYEVPELPVAEQLRVQGGHCATDTCRAELKDSAGAWDLLGLSASKPRRCHYSGMLYCFQCHSRKTAIVPGKVIHRWDFTPYRVCDAVHVFLTGSLYDPLYDIGTLQPSLYMKIARLQACLALRSQLIIIGEVVSRCKDIRSTSSVDLTSHVFKEQDNYSIAELERAARGELVTELKTLRDECVRHIVQTCAVCRSRTVRRCASCNGDDQIYIFDTKNVVRCVHCREAYHVPCYEVVGCRMCKDLATK